MESMSAAKARQACLDLAARCTPDNSSASFRAHLAAIDEAFAEGDLAHAAELIDYGAANVADMARGADMEITFDETDFVADEESTEAYSILDDVRFRFGLLELDRQPSNITIFKA